MLDWGADLLRDQLLGLVKQMLAKDAITRPLALDDPLTEVGLSSIDMVNLMLAVEAEFDIMIPNYEITPANFRTVSTIAALIVKIKSCLQPRNPENVGVERAKEERCVAQIFRTSTSTPVSLGEEDH
jgi:acyl carrier protein